MELANLYPLHFTYLYSFLQLSSFGDVLCLLHFFFMLYCYVKENFPNVIPCSFLTAPVFSGSEWYFKKWWGHPSAIYLCTISERSCFLSFSDNFIIHTLFLWLFW